MVVMMLLMRKIITVMVGRDRMSLKDDIPSAKDYLP